MLFFRHTGCSSQLLYQRKAHCLGKHNSAVNLHHIFIKKVAKPTILRRWHSSLELKVLSRRMRNSVLWNFTPQKSYCVQWIE